MLPGMSCLKTLMGKKRALSPFLLRVSLYTLWWLIHIRDNYSERLLLWGGGGEQKEPLHPSPHAVSCWQCSLQFLSEKTRCHTLISNFSICQELNKNVN